MKSRNYIKKSDHSQIERLMQFSNENELNFTIESNSDPELSNGARTVWIFRVVLVFREHCWSCGGEELSEGVSGELGSSMRLAIKNAKQWMKLNSDE